MSEPPPNYKTPPFPSLNVHTLSDETDNKIYTLYHIGDIWRFTAVWTAIVYAVFHIGAVMVALMTHGFKRRSWKLLWLAPIVYLSVAGVEAVLSGSIVGLMYVQGPEMVMLRSVVFACGPALTRLTLQTESAPCISRATTR